MSGRMSGGGSFGGGRGGGFGGGGSFGGRGGSFGGGSRSSGSGRMSGGRSFGSTGPGISRSGGNRNVGGNRGVPVGGGFGVPQRPMGGSGFLPGMMAGGLLGSSMGRRRGWGWGGGGGMSPGCGCGGILGALLVLFLLFSMFSTCSGPGVTTSVNAPVNDAPVNTSTTVMLDARAENDFNSNDHVGQDVVNVPFDDYFEENAVYMIPNRNTAVEVCSYDSPTAAEIVTIMQNDLGYSTVTNAGVCGR